MPTPWKRTGQMGQTVQRPVAGMHEIGIDVRTPIAYVIRSGDAALIVEAVNTYQAVKERAERAEAALAAQTAKLDEAYNATEEAERLNAELTDYIGYVDAKGEDGEFPLTLDQWREFNASEAVQGG